MLLTEVYEQLAYGELRNTVLGTGALDSSADGSMPEAIHAKILPLVKMGITELHKRFLLREVTVAEPLIALQANYTLAPTDDDLLKVHRIYGTYLTNKYEIPLNEVNNELSIRTPTDKTIIVPTDNTKAPWLLETNSLSIVYQADHVAIPAAMPWETVNITTISLPRTHLWALCLYIASRVTNSMGFAGEMHEGNNYAIKFEQEVASLKGFNYEIDTGHENTKLTDRGFA